MKASVNREELVKLVEAAQRGDAGAQGALIRATQKDLFRFLMFLVGNRPLAQDLAQETYIRALESLSELRDGGGFQSWLFRVGKNLYLDHVRSPKNAEALDISELVELASETRQMESILEIRDLLSPLSPEDRYGFLLVYLEGYAYGEAAEMMGISENALRSRLHRAKLKLEEATLASAAGKISTKALPKA